jgi:hypothetical protein
VRFNRAGILYSQPMDIRTQLEEFTQAFASLMMLDREAFGYDTTFSTRLNQDDRLEYYVNLPESAFNVLSEEKTAAVFGPSTQPGEALGPPTRRPKVMERLCYRKGILGRVTTVLRLHEVVPPSVSLSKSNKAPRHAANQRRGGSIHSPRNLGRSGRKITC